MSQILLSQSIDIGTESTYIQKAPYAGLLKDVTVSWPAGCNGLVEVAVGYGSVQVTPIEGFIALNDKIITWYLGERYYVDRGAILWQKSRNYDAVYVHTIVVVVTLEPVREGYGRKD